MNLVCLRIADSRPLFAARDFRQRPICPLHGVSGPESREDAARTLRILPINPIVISRGQLPGVNRFP